MQFTLDNNKGGMYTYAEITIDDIDPDIFGKKCRSSHYKFNYANGSVAANTEQGKERSFDLCHFL